MIMQNNQTADPSELDGMGISLLMEYASVDLSMSLSSQKSTVSSTASLKTTLMEKTGRRS